MIKLFEFQEKEIRTVQEAGKTWFSGSDVFSVLGLTWKGASDLINKRGIDPKKILRRTTNTSGGNQEMVFIDEIVLYKITLRANKSEIADKFTDWVSELLVKLRTGELLLKQNFDFKSHLETNIQKNNSKKINAVNFNNGGVTKTIEYNVKNCQLHTNQKPYQIIQMGKDLGLKSKQTTSAKEVIRNLKPELACSMSFTDKLVSEDNINHEIAVETSLKYAQPLFKQLMEIGIDRSLLE